MRYDDWDVLLFPGDSHVPIKEFRVVCGTSVDAEFSREAEVRIPTMICWIPSLGNGVPFKVSVHSWADGPDPSAKAKMACTSVTDKVKFEARVFVHGHLAGAAALGSDSKWPYVIENSIGRSGSLEMLTFPPCPFGIGDGASPEGDVELLNSINVVIGEGLCRDQPPFGPVPLGRVGNTVVFSFRHAPIEWLEEAGIAWPNRFLRQPPCSLTARTVPAFHPPSSEASHVHSPRRHGRLPAMYWTSHAGPRSFSGLSAVDILGREDHHDVSSNDSDLQVRPETGCPASPSSQSHMTLWDWQQAAMSQLSATVAAASQVHGQPLADPFSGGGEASDSSMADAHQWSRNGDGGRSEQSGLTRGGNFNFWTRYSDGSVYSERAALDEEDALSFMLHAPANTPASKTSEASSNEAGTPLHGGAHATLDTPAAPYPRLLANLAESPFAAPEPGSASTTPNTGACGTGEVKSRKDGLFPAEVTSALDSDFAMPGVVMRNSSLPTTKAGEAGDKWCAGQPRRVFSHSFANTELPMSPISSQANSTGDGVAGGASNNICFLDRESHLTGLSPEKTVDSGAAH